MKLSKIKFSCYKKFKEYNELEIRPITVLVGKNSSGKSSVLKLLPMLSNSFTGWYKQPILFENKGVTSGISFDDISYNGERAGMEIGADFADGTCIKATLSSTDGDTNVTISRYLLSYRGQQYELSYDREQKAYNSTIKKELYEIGGFHGLLNYDLLNDIGENDIYKETKFDVDYIGPFRSIPPRSIYYKGDCDMMHVGYDGGNAYNVLCSSQEIAKQVSGWFEENFDGTKIEALKAKERGTFHVMMRKKGHEDFPINIVDEGQGIGQILPIVTRCHMGSENSYVVMEQPELHLHPAAHAAIAKLLAETSKAHGTSYIVETHSKNFLLGLQDMVVDRNIPLTKDDVIIYFVDETEDGFAYLRPITINDEGDLSYWPKGVFEESSAIYDDIERKVFANREEV